MTTTRMQLTDSPLRANRRQQVLVVDDQPSNVTLLEKALASEYEVLTALSGEAGLAIAATALPDLILLDVMMPGLDGFEVCRRLKEDPGTADIPVLFVTAMDSPEDELHGLQQGAVDYLTKPINVPVVRARVKSHMELRKYQRLKSMLANLDGLTELANRPYFEAQLQQAWIKARADGQPLSLVMADIDEFEAYAGRHGRVAGDQCLKAVAASVSLALQAPDDLAARFTADVFALLLPGTEAAQARQVAEGVRQSVEAMDWSHPDGSWGHVTVSCCVLTCVPGEDEMPEHFLDQADTLISAAKVLGRNRVVGMEDVGDLQLPPQPPLVQRDQEAIVHSIASITDQQDLQSLDQGLVSALQEMLQPSFVMILEGKHQGGMRVAISQGPAGLELPAELESEMLQVDDLNPHLTMLGDTRYLYCNLGSAQGDGRRMLLMGGRSQLGAQLGVFNGMLRVYQNFIRLIREGQRDTLTGLQNRKTLEVELSSLLASFMNGRRDSDSAKGAALAVLDLDKFKRINDTFGHLIGDEVLLIFSQILKTSLRAQDRAFRYGGEEFIAILNDVSEQEARDVLERLRQNVEDRDFPQVGRVTVSIGYTLVGTQMMPAQVIEEADKALYFAKENGRNQISWYGALPGAAQNGSDHTGDIELF